MSTMEHGRRGSNVRAIAPLYKRLPKGPHGIAPEDVIHHQRIRMHGAMIEAVASHGYERTSVKHVIGLAGVSRRAFYEQFTNKEDCFMETFDLIVTRTLKRVNGACRSREGPLDKRLRAALQALVEEIEANPKALSLVLIDALTTGPEGQLRLRRAMAACEQLLGSALAAPPAEHPLPGPLVRAIVGGLRRATFVRLCDGGEESRSVLSAEMLRWTLLFTEPAAQALKLRTSSVPPLPRVVQVQPRAAVSGSASGPESDYACLLESVVNLALREPYEELSAPHIAEEAGLSIDTFLDLFESPRECFEAALDMHGGELLEAVADPDLVSPEWPTAVCQAVDRLTAHLVANPAATVMLAAKTFGAGLEAIEGMVRLGDEVATLLTEGAPRRARRRLAREWISGALAHTLHTEVMAGRAHLLESLSEYLSYVVLAPFIGPEQATRTILDARPDDLASGVSPAERSIAAAEELLAMPILATPVGAPLGEVGQDDADEEGDDDDDYQRSLTGPEDPVDLDLVEIEDGEERDEDGEQDERSSPHQLAP